jgi:2,4-dienoyl-CoA reductase-like NADH-dependent reductase (Old Yellow Enzyme family)
MNTQLVESLIQVISSLSVEEQSLLGERLADRQSAMSQNLIQFNVAKEDVIQPLIAAGRIAPPRHCQDIASISEADLREMTRNIKISGKPLSETVIEDRGEW